MDTLVVFLYHIVVFEDLDHNLLLVDKDFVEMEKGLAVEDKDLVVEGMVLVVEDNFVEV